MSSPEGSTPSDDPVPAAGEAIVETVVEDEEGNSVEEEVIEEEVIEEEEIVEEEIIEEEIIEEEIIEDGEGTIEETIESGEQPSSGTEQPSTQEGDDKGVDEENQVAAPVIPTPSVEKKVKDINPCWYYVCCLAVLGLLGGGAYGGYYLVEEKDQPPPVLEDDDFTFSPTAAPTVPFTTAFDAIQGNCDFEDLEYPHVIDQCNCGEEVEIIADDVLERYNFHRIAFTPTLYENYDDEISSCSPRNQALLWISSANDFQFTYEQRVERYALATFFAALDGTNWNNRQFWLDQSDVCGWGGVVCGEDGSVQALVLDDNNLQGTMPGEISLLQSLLQFFATRNLIEGPIPIGLFAIPFLQFLDLGVNQLTGPVPPNIGDAELLKEVNLASNSLSGRLSEDLGGASNLEKLNLFSNQLAGTIPLRLFEAENLVELNLSRNQFEGPIPAEIGNLQNLESLVLGANALMGELPESIGDLTNLKILSLRGSPFLGGRLPVGIGRNLTALEELTITGSRINDNLASIFGAQSNLTSLVTLDLSGNELRGSIPDGIGASENVMLMDLSNNFFDGTLPSSLGSLSNLEELNLNDNLFREGIPVAFSGLASLERLRLDGTRLTGRVPQEVCDLREDGELVQFLVDCPGEDNGVEVGVSCAIPECCSGCRGIAGNV